MKTPFLQLGFVVFLLLSITVGCSKAYKAPPSVTPEQELTMAKQTLQYYVDGNSMGSEIESFESLVTSTRKVDPKKGDILEKGFAELKKTGSGPALKSAAKKILDQL